MVTLGEKYEYVFQYVSIVIVFFIPNLHVDILFQLDHHFIHFILHCCDQLFFSVKGKVKSTSFIKYTIENFMNGKPVQVENQVSW